MVIIWFKTEADNIHNVSGGKRNAMTYNHMERNEVYIFEYELFPFGCFVLNGCESNICCDVCNQPIKALMVTKITDMCRRKPIFLAHMSYLPWWHQMETFPTWLALCAGNSPTTPTPSQFPSRRPVTRGFDIFFDLRLNKLLSKQSSAGDMRHHRPNYVVNVMHNTHPMYFDKH